MIDRSQRQYRPLSQPVEAAGETPVGCANKGLGIEIVIAAGDWQVLEPIEETVNSTVGALTTQLGPGDMIEEIQVATLALANNEHIANLNATFRGKPTATNVLSFSAPEGTLSDPEGGCTAVYLGDVVMAFETLAAEAIELKIPLRDHFRHLLVHGLLHLLGYDHETTKEARQMEAIEVSVLQTLGVATPYPAGQEA